MGTYRTLSAEQGEEIVSAFAAGEYRGHVAIPAGTVNTSVAVDTSDGRRWFLRVNEGKSREDVAREAAIVAHLAARGVPAHPPLRVPATGEPFLHWQGVYVSLFPWIVGRELSRAELQPHHARAAGAALASLHLAGADFADRRPGRYELDEILRRLAHIESLSHGAGDAAADPVLVDAVAVLRPELTAVAAERRPDLPAGLIHGDLFIDNVLFTEDGRLAALLDFEQASWGLLAYDVAVSVLAFGFGRDDFRPDATRAFLDGYRGGRTPTEAERAGFAAELRFASCRFAVTRITDVYLRRAAGAPAGKDFRRYLTRLRRVQEHLARADGLLDL
jgi:homoserine kinase type II